MKTKPSAKQKETMSTSAAPQVTRAGATQCQCAKCKAKAVPSREGGPGSGPHEKDAKQVAAASKKLGDAQKRETLATSRLQQFQKKIADSGDQSLWTSKEYQDRASEYKSAVAARQKAMSDAKNVVGSAKQSSRTKPVKLIRERGSFSFMGRIREAAGDAAQAGKRFRVTLLQEGLGNFGDAFYYTGAAIESAVPIFEGRKFMVDHPAQSEETDRPERSVRDIAGYFENLAAEEIDGRMCLVGDCVVAGDPSDPSDPFARERVLMRESLAFQAKHPDDALVGLSINAGGDFDTVPIEQFLESADIPDACKPKVLEAVKQGVTVVRPVRAMQTAVSCDLVTTAGAGGSINQLIEGGKGKMGLKAKQVEAEEKESHEHESQHEADGPDASGADDGADDGADADGDADQDTADGQDGEHADADQDAELIKSMLDKYVGQPDHSDDDKQAMKQALKSAQEAGLEGKEAEKAAGYSIKMAKQAAMKQAKQAEESQHEADAGPGMDAKGPASVGNPGSAKGMQKAKESAKAPDLVRLTAENARLQSELSVLKLEKHMDKALRESKLPMSATKKFRECAKGVASVKEFEEKLAVFKEAYSLRGEAQDEPGFILTAEKQGGSEDGAAGLDFSDCAAD